MKENNTALEKTLREKNEFLQALFQVQNIVVSRPKSLMYNDSDQSNFNIMKFKPLDT